MNLLQEIYDNKMLVAQREDFDALAELIANSEVKITNNDDRTFLLEYESEIPIDHLNTSISKWLGPSLTCAPKHVYNILPLNAQSALIRI